jgi:hypothetical protein
VLLVGTVIAAAVPMADADTIDIASTMRYVSDTSALFNAIVAANKREKAAVNAVVERVSAHCRGELPNYVRTGTAAQQGVWTALANDETSGELIVALLRPIHKEYAAAARRLERLRWTRPAINRAVTAEARRTLAALALKPPDQCADVRAAAATQFTMVPADAKRFIARATRLFRASDAAPAFAGSLKMFTRYITAGEKPKVRALNSLEAKLNRILDRPDFNAYLRTIDALRGT